MNLRSGGGGTWHRRRNRRRLRHVGPGDVGGGQLRRRRPPEIALGDVLGSNVVNIGLILGIALVFAAITVDGGTMVREYPAAVAAPVLVGLLAPDGGSDRSTGWYCWSSSRYGWPRVRSRRGGSEPPPPRSVGTLPRLGDSQPAVGLALLIAAGRSSSPQHSVSARPSAGMDSSSARRLSLGTSAPELATVVIARVRGHDGGRRHAPGQQHLQHPLIVGTAAIIHPIRIDSFETDVGGGPAPPSCYSSSRSRAGWRGGGVCLCWAPTWWFWLCWRPEGRAVRRLGAYMRPLVRVAPRRSPGHRREPIPGRCASPQRSAARRTPAAGRGLGTEFVTQHPVGGNCSRRSTRSAWLSTSSPVTPSTIESISPPDDR